MSAVGDGGIEFLQGPVVLDVNGTPGRAVLTKGGSKWVSLCQFAGEHVATGGDITIALTLGLGENVRQVSCGEWGYGVTNGVEPFRGGSEAGRVCDGGDSVEATRNTRGRIGGFLGWWRWGGRGVTAFGVLLGDVVSDFVEVVGVLELTSGCSGGWAC